MRKPANYLNNKDMLLEIHRSKTSYCEYADDHYAQYDIIVDSVEELNDPEIIETAKINRAKRIGNKALAAAKLHALDNGLPKVKGADYKIQPDTILDKDLVFRVHTYDHIPLAPGRKKTPKTVADNHVKVAFIPFKHYVLTLDEEDKIMQTLKGEMQFTEVLRSHSKDGAFSDTHGAITTKLARMYLLMVGKYGQRSNWRGYTYLDEMKGQALLQLSQMGLKFNEAKSDNPFSYYTASIANSFTRVLNIEKRNQNIRDDLLIDAGQNPSFSRQIAVEEEIRRLRDDVETEIK